MMLRPPSTKTLYHVRIYSTHLYILVGLVSMVIHVGEGGVSEREDQQ
jgi:hypothetical protein